MEMKQVYTFLDVIGFFRNHPDIIANLSTVRIAKTPRNSVSAFLDCNMNWVSTPQGHAYWRHIENRTAQLERLGIDVY